MSRILVVLCHPQLEHSRISRALADAARGVAGTARGVAGTARSLSGTAIGTDGPDGPQVEVRDLYALYPDYLVDVAAEQAALAGVQLLVWLHPVHWYGMPPLMKLWLDEVFAFGWAYGPGGTALAGTDLWLATSTGGPADSYHPAGYNRYFFDAFLPPYEQTAALVGMRFLPPLVLHGAHRADTAAIAAHAQVFADRLRSYPAWPEIDELPPCMACEVPSDARPDDALVTPARPAD